MPEATTEPVAQPTRVHAFGDDALADLDAVGLVEQLQARQVSIPEAIDAAIARVQQVAPQLGALAHEDFAGARRRAQVPHGGFFAGVPTLLKDNVQVGGWPTQHGADAFRAVPERRHGDLARMMLATGLLPLGKTQLSEFGFSASAEHPRLGPVRNPWSLEHTAGASSAGSAALVAAGAVPLAHGNDGGGSIRIPAAVCGLVGLKPTRGRLAQDKMMRDMPVRIVSDGVLTRSVRDQAAFYRECEQVWRNARLPEVGDVAGPGNRRLRVALVTRSLDREATPEVVEATRATGLLLQGLGHHVEELDPPVYDGFAEDFLLYWSVLAVFLLRTGRHTFGPTYEPSMTDALTRGLDRHWRHHAHRFPRAVARLAASKHQVHEFARRYDVVLTPTLAHATPQLGYLDPRLGYETVIERLRGWVAYTPLANANGQPAISLPLATSSTSAGAEMPLGMMLSADWGQESTLLELAYELEQTRPWSQIQA